MSVFDSRCRSLPRPCRACERAQAGLRNDDDRLPATPLACMRARTCRVRNTRFLAMRPCKEAASSGTHPVPRCHARRIATWSGAIATPRRRRPANAECVAYPAIITVRRGMHTVSDNRTATVSWTAVDRPEWTSGHARRNEFLRASDSACSAAQKRQVNCYSCGSRRAGMRPGRPLSDIPRRGSARVHA